MLKITNCVRYFTHHTPFLPKRRFPPTKHEKLDPLWRENRGLPINPNSCGPLTSLPDYTFLDGRQTPMGSNQRKRLVRQREVAAKIVEFSTEIDYAKERAERMKAKEAAKRQEILASKLKQRKLNGA